MVSTAMHPLVPYAEHQPKGQHTSGTANRETTEGSEDTPGHRHVDTLCNSYWLQSTPRTITQRRQPVTGTVA
eukprot:202447-Prorocentrum_lima.AAC.1